MKSYLSLIPVSAKRHKRKNKMTLFCIIIAVFLVTAIFSMADMGMRMEKIRLIDKHGNWHILLEGVAEQDAEAVSARRDVAAASRYNVINYDLEEDYSIGGKKAVFCGVDKPFVTEIWQGVTENAYPENDSGIILSANAKEVLGIQTGDRITLTMPSGNVEFTVFGFSEDTELILQYDAVGAMMTMPAFDKICARNRVEVPNPAYYVRFDGQTWLTIQ